MVTIFATGQSSQKYNSYLNRNETYNSSGQQELPKKWNEYLKRYEIYDSYGKMKGDYKYNSYLDKWEYTSSSY